MIKINNIKISISQDESLIKNKINKKVEKILKVTPLQIKSIEITKKSIDARDKNNIVFVYSVEVQLNCKRNFKNYNKDVIEVEDCDLVKNSSDVNLKRIDNYKGIRPVIVGCGPSGLFAALVLAERGLRPIILERGKDVDSRKLEVDNLWNKGILNTECNVQFGEGGAGTFSDGKLTTRIKDERKIKVLEELIEAGADPEIKISATPHIGTDKLIDIVKNIREKIISLGGEVRFSNKLTKINCINNKVKSVRVESDGKTYELETDSLILALGHSARDTVSMLFENGLYIEPKAFSVGVRIEHSQNIININQYGSEENIKILGAADYKLSARLKSGRGLYTFCMCPGGHVVCSSSEKNRLVTNGMSYHSRDNENANSGLLISVSPSDYMDDSNNPLAGIEFQRRLEEKAFILGGGNYTAPAQLVGDFLLDKQSKEFRSIKPSYMPRVVGSDLRQCLDAFIVDGLKEGLLLLDKKLNGFSSYDAVMTAVETRSSSPVILKRDSTTYMSNIEGIFPCGEGAGYAGGIISAAVDGIRCATAMKKV